MERLTQLMTFQEAHDLFENDIDKALKLIIEKVAGEKIDVENVSRYYPLDSRYTKMFIPSFIIALMYEIPENIKKTFDFSFNDGSVLGLFNSILYNFDHINDHHEKCNNYIYSAKNYSIYTDVDIELNIENYDIFYARLKPLIDMYNLEDYYIYCKENVEFLGFIIGLKMIINSPFFIRDGDIIEVFDPNYIYHNHVMKNKTLQELCYEEINKNLPKVFIGSIQDVAKFINKNYIKEIDELSRQTCIYPKEKIYVHYSGTLKEILQKIGITFTDRIISLNEREFVFYKK